MKRSLTDIYIGWFARPSLARFHQFFVRLGLRGLGVMNWRSPDLSGETNFLQTMLPAIDRAGSCVVDIGANEGNFIDAALGASRHLSILAVEPHPRTFSRLKARFAPHRGRVDLVNVGAGDEDATLLLYDHGGQAGTEHASYLRDAIESVHHSTATSIQTQVRRMDDVIAERGAKVAAIKIDVEGFELAVLRGLRRTIASHDVAFIMLEFNEMNTLSRTFVRDIIAELPHYRPYRILPKGRLLAITPYKPMFAEIFAYQNLAFIRS